MENQIRKIANKIYEEVSLNVVPIINCISEGSITFTYDYLNENDGKQMRITLSITTEDDIFNEESFGQLLKKNISFIMMTIYEYKPKRLFRAFGKVD